MNLGLVLVLLLFTTMSSAQELYSRLFIPSQKGQLMTEVNGRIRYQEEEFEQREIVQNQTEIRHQEVLLGVGYLAKQNHLVQFHLEAIPEGKGEESFPANNPATLRKYEVSGFKRFGAGYLFRHRDLEIQNLTHGFALKIFANPLRGKDTNGAINRTDLLLDYHYEYQLNSFWSVFGKVGTHLYGKQRTKLSNDGIRVDDSYTQVEADFGFSYSRSKIFFTLFGLFSQMTDFTSRTPLFTRATDKGYSVGGQAELGYNHNNLWLMSLGHQRRSDVFNAISDRIEDDLDYEYESGATWLKLKYLF